MATPGPGVPTYTPPVKNDSERSDDEKHSLGQEEGGVVTANTASGLPPDPDAHLSAEERAVIV